MMAVQSRIHPQRRKNEEHMKSSSEMTTSTNLATEVSLRNKKPVNLSQQTELTTNIQERVSPTRDFARARGVWSRHQDCRSDVIIGRY
jgi:uncharacterized membrane-anchored protein YhcB (DUF1043 family)